MSIEAYLPPFPKALVTLTVLPFLCVEGLTPNCTAIGLDLGRVQAGPRVPLTSFEQGHPGNEGWSPEHPGLGALIGAASGPTL